MKLGLVPRNIIISLAALLIPHTVVLAGTNDLFRSHATWKAVSPETADSVNTRPVRLRLTNRGLMNLALDANVSDNLRLGLQCDCSSHRLSVVIYDAPTLVTVAALADLATDSYQSNGKKEVLTASGNIVDSGLILGGQFTAKIVVEPGPDTCIKKAKLTASGTIEVQTADGTVILNLDHARLRTSGKQLRPLETTGSGSSGSGGSTTGGSGGISSSGTLMSAGGLIVGNGIISNGVVNLTGDVVNLIGGGVDIVTTNTWGSAGTLITGGSVLTNLSGRLIGGVFTNTSGGLIGGVLTDTGGGSSTLLLDGSSFPHSLRQLLQTVNLGTNSVFTFTTAQLETELQCGGGMFNVDAGQSIALDVGLCSNLVINLSSGSVLNVCTNGMADDALNVLQGAVSGEGTLNLTDCPSPTLP